ncbi:threonine/homoserine efflux transporter RhtA [Actinocorallia herbida]|uniref:Threonine/homoserine efflux transporter RhtA n=1 Tax=Actinocorallia herbida TaxID=58109 RepID=A0A3N1DBE3_9ACTN|nr:EamA family transporter [Actinocorallia herbida]ROO90847.1 threonine/homoserine efflux transporter RhtA [Actinocorallia herbida]
MSRQGRPLALALLSALAFGSSGVAAKPLIDAGLDPLHVAWLRIAGTALLLSPLAWRHRALLRERPVLLLGFGMLGIAGVQAFYFASLSRIPVAVALLVEYLGPLLVLGWVRFVRRAPVSRAASLGVVLAVAGLACVVQIWSGLAFDALGLAFALCAAVCQAGYFLLADQGTGDDQPDPLGVITFGFLAAALALTVVARPWTMDFGVLAGTADLGGREIAAFLPYGYLVLVATLLAYVTGVVSVRLLSAQVAGVVACLEAVVAIVLGWFLLHERLAAPQLAGALLVLAGAFIAQRATPARDAQEKPLLEAV